MRKISTFVVLVLAFNHLAFSSVAINRKTKDEIHFHYTNGIASFNLKSHDDIQPINEFKIKDLGQLKRIDYPITSFKNSCAITRGYYDITDAVVSILGMAVFPFGIIALPIYAGYSLAYLGTLPADLVSLNNKAYRKMKKLMNGKNLKVSDKVFSKMLEMTIDFRDSPSWVSNVPYCQVVLN